MAIIRVAHTAPATLAGAVDAAVVTVNTPAGVQAGDLLLAQVMHRAAGTSVPGVAGGWTLLGARTSNWTNGTTPATQTMETWVRTAVAAEPASHTWNLPATSGRSSAGIVAYRNARIAGYADTARDFYTETTSSFEPHASLTLTLDEPVWHGKLVQFSTCVYANTSTSTGWDWVTPTPPHSGMTQVDLWGTQKAHRVHAGEGAAEVTAAAGTYQPDRLAGHYISPTDNHAWAGAALLLIPTDLDPAPARAQTARVQVLSLPTEPPPARLVEPRVQALVPTANHLAGFAASGVGADRVWNAKQLPPPALTAHHTVEHTNAPPVPNTDDDIDYIGAGYADSTVWWRFTADQTMPVQIRIVPSGADPLTYIYASAYTASIDMAGHNHRNNELTGIAGVIEAPAGLAPPHDDFETPHLVRMGDAGTWSYTDNNTHAVTQPGEPAAAPASSVWHSYTPLSDGTLEVWTSYATGDDLSDDTRIAVYTGSSLATLTELAWNDDVNADTGDYFSRVSLPVTAGTTYRIASGTYSIGSAGRYVLNLSGPPSVTGAGDTHQEWVPAAVEQQPASFTFDAIAGTTYYLQVGNRIPFYGGEPGTFTVETIAVTPTPVVAPPALDFTLYWSAGPVQWIEPPPLHVDLRLANVLLAYGGRTPVDIEPVELSADLAAGLRAGLPTPALALELSPGTVQARPVVPAPALDLPLELHTAVVQYVYRLDVAALDLSVDFTAYVRRGTRNRGQRYRWELHDPITGRRWTMPINPDSMTSPHASRDNVITHGAPRTGGGRALTVMSPPPAKRWEWSGVIRTESHYQELVEWTRVDSPVYVTDHLDRTWQVVLEEFVPEERRPTYRTNWRFRYTMRTLILRRVK